MTASPAQQTDSSRGSRILAVLRFALLLVGALAALVPFYYMVMGALQAKRDTSPLGLLPLPGNLTLNNFVEINESVNLVGSLLNSLVFTAGVGENASAVRAAALSGFEWAGIHLSSERNAVRGTTVISTDASPVAALVIPTNEELEIARQSAALL